MRPAMVVVIACWAAAMFALVYAGESGAMWPLPFALFVMAAGGLVHLAADGLGDDDDDR